VQQGAEGRDEPGHDSTEKCFNMTGIRFWVDRRNNLQRLSPFPDLVQKFDNFETPCNVFTFGAACNCMPAVR
jgi:hypothetical protein